MRPGRGSHTAGGEVIAPEPAPLFTDIAAGPAGGRAWFLRTEDGRRIRVAHWPQAATGGKGNGTVLILPGRTEYVEKYGHVAARLARAGHDSLVIDWRGQGLSERLLPDPMAGHVERFSDYQLDLAAALALARHEGLGQPRHVLAHSMGGAIALQALVEGLPAASVAFSAPMWGIAIPPWKRPLAWALGILGPALGMGARYAPESGPRPYVLDAPFAGNLLTTDADAWARMVHHLQTHPELGLGGPTLRWLGEALRACLVLSLRRAPDVPALALLGSRERIVSPGRIRRRMARWPGGSLRVFEGAEHELLMERAPIREAVLEAICAHFARHSAASSGQDGPEGVRPLSPAGNAAPGAG